MKAGTVHFLATAGWVLYSVVIGIFAIADNFTSSLVWISIIVAIVGNSAHLVSFAYSQGKLLVSSSGQAGQSNP